MSHAPGKERATNRIRRATGVVQRPPVQDFRNPVRAKPRHVRLSHALAYFVAPLVTPPIAERHWPGATIKTFWMDVDLPKIVPSRTASAQVRHAAGTARC